MNKIYKVVWNASIGTWTVVSESAKSKTKTRGSVGQITSLELQQSSSLVRLFNYKVLSLAIITIIVPSVTFAGVTNNGTGNFTGVTGACSSTSTPSTAITIGTSSSNTPVTCASAEYSIAVGQSTIASAAGATAFGSGSRATNISAVALGNDANATGKSAIAIGGGQGGNDATGQSAQATGTFAVAVGHNAVANNTNSLALGSGGSSDIGTGVAANGVQAGAAGATALGGNATAGAQALATDSIAIGGESKVNTGATNSVAIGKTAIVSTNISNAVVLGSGATVSVNNSVALGAGSTTTAPTGTGYITNSAAPTSVVSVGSATNTRRIQNVADGAADSDAVTVAQLKDVNNRAVGNTTALGGGAAYNPATDVYTAPSYTITKTDGTTYTPVNTVSGALTNLNNEVVKPITFAGNTGSSANNLGTTLNITGAGSTAGTYSGNNLKTAVTGNTVNIQMAEAPVFSGTVTAGNLTTGGSLNVTGASNLNGGANLNNQKITNLAAGTISSTSTDAVNGSQLNTTNQNVTTAQNTANTAVTNAAAAPFWPSNG